MRIWRALYNYAYRLMIKAFIALLVLLLLVQVMERVNTQPYEEAFIHFLARQDPAKFARQDVEQQLNRQLGHKPGMVRPEIKADVERTYEFKLEQWENFKHGISDTVMLTLDVLGLGEKTRQAAAQKENTAASVPVSTEMERPRYGGSWTEIAGDNLKNAAQALLRVITVRVMQIGDKPVIVVKKTVVPFDQTDNILRWAPEIQAAAEKYEISPAIIAAVMEQESGGNAQAVSHAGAIGLMQLMPGTADFLGVNPYNPAQNIDGGAKYLAMQLEEFGNVTQALAAYNAGPGNVYNNRYLYISETQNYIRKVPKLIEKYRQQFEQEVVEEVKEEIKL